MQIHVTIHHDDDDGYWAESPDVDQWSAAADTLPELIGLIETGLQFALEHPTLSITDERVYLAQYVDVAVGPLLAASNVTAAIGERGKAVTTRFLGSYTGPLFRHQDGAASPAPS